MNKNVIFIGGCGHGKETANGVSAKNYFLLSRLKEVCTDVKVIDTDGWKRHPLILLRLLLTLLRFKQHQVIISLNPGSAYLFIRFLGRLQRRRTVCNFVIGGNLAELLSKGSHKQRPYRQQIKYFMVESRKMEEDLKQLGFTNVIYVPNFKDVGHLPVKKQPDEKAVRFVFLSRIIPEKGCDYIIEAAKRLNDKGLGQRFAVDFYGQVDSNYRQRFMKSAGQVPNISYKGFLDLREGDNYNILARYDVMLFPTYWHGEGFPGVVIDAFIAGLPVIATDWQHNSEIINHQQTGILIPVHDTEALAEQMTYMIMNKAEIARMSRVCQEQARQFDTHSVLSNQLFCQILAEEPA